MIGDLPRAITDLTRMPGTIQLWKANRQAHKCLFELDLSTRGEVAEWPKAAVC
jgi:hypothetical protein